MEVDDLSLSRPTPIDHRRGRWLVFYSQPSCQVSGQCIGPKIVEIAKFAVSEHNKESKASCTRRSSEEPGIGRRFGIAA